MKSQIGASHLAQKDIGGIILARLQDLAHGIEGADPLQARLKEIFFAGKVVIDEPGAFHSRGLSDELIGRAIVAVPGEAVERGLDNRGFAGSRGGSRVGPSVTSHELVNCSINQIIVA